MKNRKLIKAIRDNAQTVADSLSQLDKDAIINAVARQEELEEQVRIAKADVSCRVANSFNRI